MLGAQSQTITSASTRTTKNLPGTLTEAQLSAAKHTFYQTAVSNRHFAKKTLYTWTTAAQADALRKSNQLLVYDAQKAERPSRFDYRIKIHSTAGETDSFVSAMLSDNARLSKRRFAWTTPWATRIPMGPTSYGDELVKITLRDGAIVGRFDDTQSPSWQFQRLDGTTVTTDQLQKEPFQLAAAMHIRPIKKADRVRPIAGEVEFDPIYTGYREYVVFNEELVESWELCTGDIENWFISASSALMILSEYQAQNPWDSFAWHYSNMREVWERSIDDGDLVDLYLANLAFHHVEAYAPTPSNLQALVQLLQTATRRCEPHKVNAK